MFRVCHRDLDPLFSKDCDVVVLSGRIPHLQHEPKILASFLPPAFLLSAYFPSALPLSHPTFPSLGLLHPILLQDAWNPRLPSLRVKPSQHSARC